MTEADRDQVKQLLGYYREVARVLGAKRGAAAGGANSVGSSDAAASADSRTLYPEGFEDERADAQPEDFSQTPTADQHPWSLLWFFESCCDELNPLTLAFLGDEGARTTLSFVESPLREGTDEFIEDERKSPNENQRKAIRRALANSISFVQGPPGTGKTDTILNMVSCILARGKTVAVVSRNAAALDNIAVKVEEHAKVADGTTPNAARVVQSFAKLGNAEDRKGWSREHDNGLVFRARQGGWERSISSEEFLARYPFITSTVHSLKKCFCDGATYQYDYVIVDEASQCDIVAGLVAMSCAKHLVLVGDKEQLPPVYDDGLESALPPCPLAQGADRYGLKDSTAQEGQSILVACSRVFEPLGAPHTFLNEHYRCHPGIIEFCKENVYDLDTTHDSLEIRTPKYDRGVNTPVKILWFQGDYCERCRKGDEAQAQTRRGIKATKRNMKQIKVFMDEEWPELRGRLRDPDFSVCVLSPFRGQLDALKAAIDQAVQEERRLDAQRGHIDFGDEMAAVLRDSGGDELDSDKDPFGEFSPTMLTIHKAQGQEFDLIYLLPVEDGDWEWPWSQAKRLINVAVSRAKKELRVLVSTCLMDERTQRDLTEDYIAPRDRQDENLDQELRDQEEQRQRYIQKLVDYVRDRTDPDNLSEFKGEEGYPFSAYAFGFHESKLRSIFDDVPRLQRDERVLKASAPERCLRRTLDRMQLKEYGFDYRMNVPLIECFPKNTWHTLTEGDEIDGKRYSKEDKERFVAPNGKRDDGKESHFDFVIFDRTTRRIILAIEVDGPPHRFCKDPAKLDRIQWCDNCKDLIAKDYGAALWRTNDERLRSEQPADPTFVFLRLPSDGSTCFETNALRPSFGDRFEHMVTIEKLIDEQAKNHGDSPRLSVSFVTNTRGKASAMPVDRGRCLGIKNLLSTWEKMDATFEPLSPRRANELLCEGGFIAGAPGRGWTVTSLGRSIGIVQAENDPADWEPRCLYSAEASGKLFDYLRAKTSS